MSEERERHDLLFRRTFENVKNAAVELRALLPEALCAKVDWDSLEVESGALRGTGKRMECDLLYRARVQNKEAYFYVLFEHQSTVDPSMPLRILLYVAGILERLSKSKPLPLPVVIPLVLHHSESGWTARKDLHSLFDPEVLAIKGVAPLVPQVEFLLDDVSQLDDTELLRRATTARDRQASFALWALRDGRNGVRLRQNLEHWLRVVAETWDEEGTGILLEDVLWYISLVDNGLSHQDLLAAADRAALPETETLMSIAEQLRQEGRQEGRLEGQVAVLEMQLRLKFGELSSETRQKITSASAETLNVWIQRVLSAESLDEVLS